MRTARQDCPHERCHFESALCTLCYSRGVALLGLQILQTIELAIIEQCLVSFYSFKVKLRKMTRFHVTKYSQTPTALWRVRRACITINQTHYRIRQVVWRYTAEKININSSLGKNENSLQCSINKCSNFATKSQHCRSFVLLCNMKFPKQVGSVLPTCLALFLYRVTGPHNRYYLEI